MSIKVSKKIIKVMEKVNYLQKDGKVEYGRTKYTYLSEEKITSEIRQALIEVGLVIYPVKMDIIGEKEVRTKSGESTILTISATYRIQDVDSGEYIEVQTIGEGMDSGDKTAYKAMTGAFKYAQRQTFAIPTGDDPDHTASEQLTAGDKSQNIKQTNYQQEASTINQRKAIYAKAGNLALTGDKMKNMIKKLYNKESSKELTKQEASDLIKRLSVMENNK